MRKRIIAANSLLVLVVALYNIVFTPATFAQEKTRIIVSPAKQQVSGRPGETIYGNVHFFNESDQSIDIHFSPVNFIVTRNDGAPTYIFNDIAFNKYFASDWIVLPFENTVVSGRSEMRLPIPISIPRNASPGGHYVAIIFKTKQNTSIPSSQNTVQQTNSGIAALIDIVVPGNYIEKIIVDKLITNGPFLEHGPIKVVADIKNTGDIHVAASPSFILKNIFGHTINQQNVPSFRIFPGSTRQTSAVFNNSFLFGPYRIVYYSSYGHNMSLYREAYVWVVPWRLILIVVLFIVLIFLLFSVRNKKSVLKKQVQ